MTSRDDLIIKQISDTIKKIKVERVVYRIESLDHDAYDDYDQDEYFDKIYKILLPLNKQVKKAFDLCVRIEDTSLQNNVYLFLEGVLHASERSWDHAIQSCVEEEFGSWDELFDNPDLFDESMEECMEVTFDEYLKTHDKSLFELSID